MRCRFCNLEEKETHHIVETFEHCLVIFSNPRLMPGHLLVVPKRHVLSLGELDTDERRELFDTVIAYQEKILQHIATGCDIRQHNRPFLPENDLKVDHIHLHLQPRHFEDELYRKSQIHDREIFKPLPDEEVEEILQKLSSI